MKKACGIIALIAAIALVAIAAIVYIRLPIVSASSTLPLTVSFTGLENGGAYPISAGLSVRAQAISGAPIRRIELWTDGTLFDTQEAPEGDVYVYGHTWTWTPTTLGDHTLVVRAFDAEGRASPSSVLHIRGVPNPGMIAVVTATAKDTLASIAHDHGSTVDDILAANPGLDPKAPLSGDIFVPVPPPAENGTSHQPVVPEASSPNSGSRATPDLSLGAWFRLDVVKPLEALWAPTAPQLSAAAAGCSVQLTINDLSTNEDGFHVYRLDPQTSDFDRIGTLSSHAGTGAVPYTDSNLLGTYQYYVSAFDGSGEGISNFAKVDVGGAACAQLADTFTPSQLVNFDPGQVDQVYLYLSVNDGDWRRIPQYDFQFIPPETEINLSKTASMLVSKPVQSLAVRGEVWGWSGGSLVFLGTFDKTLPPPPKPSSPPDFAETSSILSVGKQNPESFGFLWVDQKSVGPLGSETFRWADSSGNLSGGQWQVSSMPFTDSLDLNPPGLVLTGEAPNPLGESVQFPIDLTPLSPPTTPGPQQSALSNAKSNFMPHLPPFAPPFEAGGYRSPLEAIGKFLGLPSSTQASVIPPYWSFGSHDPGNSNYMLGSPSGAIPSSNMYIRYYVRMLSMNGAQPVGEPSNTVFLDYYWQSQQISVTIPPPPAQPYELTVTDFQPLHFPLADYEFCIKITENPYYVDPNKILSQYGTGAVAYALYKPGDVYCPKKLEGHDKSWLDVLKDGFKEVLDQISSLYNKLTDFVVDLVAKLNPVCIQAKFVADAVNQGGKTVDDVCHAVAKVAVEAAKAYVGLPPSIPNYDQLQGLGEDYLTDLAAQQMEANGIPCPQDCQDLIKQGIHDSYEQVKAGFSNSACMSDSQANQLGYEHGICLPDGVKSVPDPRGLYSDGIVTVQVTRKPGFTDAQIPASCPLGVGGMADNSFWVGKVLGLEGPNRTTQEHISWQGTPLTGLAITGGASIPALQEGQPISIPVLVHRINSIYWIPGHEQSWKGFVPAPNEDDWAALYHGATISVSANSSCAQDSSNALSKGPVVGPMDSPIP